VCVHVCMYVLRDVDWNSYVGVCVHVCMYVLRDVDWNSYVGVCALWIAEIFNFLKRFLISSPCNLALHLDTAYDFQ